MPKSQLLENAQIVPIALPVDIIGGATTGDRVSLQNYRRCLFLFVKNAGGTGGEDATITLQEHDAATGGTSQNLVKIDTVYQKQAATDLTAVGVFSIATQTAAATYTNATLAEQAALLGIEVLASDLSTGFEFVSINVDDPGVGLAQLACVLAILTEPRYGVKASSMPSAIV